MSASRRAKVRKLTIHLLKPDLQDPESAVAQGQPTKRIPLGPGGTLGTLYVRRSEPKDATWIDFFSNHVPTGTFPQVNSAGGLLLVNRIGRIFAITFGSTGQFLLAPDVGEERFGLITVLNCIGRNPVKCIDKKRLDSIARHSRDQTSKKAEFRDFGIDTEQDLLAAVVGEPTDKALGNWIGGRDSLTVKAAVSLETLPVLLERIYENYNDDSYKANYAWIDNLAAVDGPGLINELNAFLIERLNQPNQTDHIWMAVPEIMNWDDLEGFRFKGRNSNELLPDIHLEAFRKSLKPDEPISLDLLKARRVDWFDGNSSPHRGWSAYECLYAEIEHQDRTFLLSGKKWYEADTNFVKSIDRAFESVPNYTKSFPDYDQDSEAKYLQELCKRFPTQYTVLDQDLIYHGGDRSKIEFCDLLSAQSDLIHVKHYTNSAPLSHLFAQGLVSGQLFKSDVEFRKKLNDKLPEGRKLADPSKRPGDQEYGVVFAIISDRPGPLRIPLFSRLTLKHSFERLTALGFRVFKAKISVTPARAMLKKGRAKAQRA